MQLCFYVDLTVSLREYQHNFYATLADRSAKVIKPLRPHVRLFQMEYDRQKLRVATFQVFSIYSKCFLWTFLQKDL